MSEITEPNGGAVAWGYVSQDTGCLLTMHPAYFGKPYEREGYNLVPLYTRPRSSRAIIKELVEAIETYQTEKYKYDRELGLSKSSPHLASHPNRCKVDVAFSAFLPLVEKARAYVEGR